MNNAELTKTLKEAKSGDTKSIEILINLVKDKILNISLYFCGDFHLAEDCSQEILIKIIRNLNKIEDATKFQNWSYTIASNYLRNYHRDNKKFANISFEAMEADSKSHLEINTDSSQESNDIRELAYELKVSCTTAMLMCLSKEDRIIFLLSNLLNINSQEIGDIIGISAPSTRKRVSRANAKLKNFIDNNCGLLNKNNSCHCRQRVNYAILQGRISSDSMYFSNNTHIKDKLTHKISKMEELEDLGDIFKNNPNYAVSNDLMKKVYQLAES